MTRSEKTVNRSEKMGCLYRPVPQRADLWQEFLPGLYDRRTMGCPGAGRLYSGSTVDLETKGRDQISLPTRLHPTAGHLFPYASPALPGRRFPGPAQHTFSLRRDLL